MKLLIDIPEEFEQHFRADRFEDSLHRLSADAHLLAGNYEQEMAVMLIEAFKTAVSVPEHGRLIEAERLKEVFHRNVASGEAFDQLIDIAPTIIPAEEGET